MISSLFSLSFLAWRCSKNPELIMPVGMATMPMPKEGTDCADDTTDDCHWVNLNDLKDFCFWVHGMFGVKWK